MDPLRYLVEQDGFFTRAQARECGYDDKHVAAMVRARVWCRFRRGYYSFWDLWSALDPVGRHRVRSRAVLHSLGGAVVLSHTSAALEHGMSPWGVDLSRVHVTRVDGGPGRIEGDVVHHTGVCLDTDLTELDGVRLVVPERAVLEAASIASSESALVWFDSFLCLELGDHEGLMGRFRDLERWPFTRHLHIPIRMADGGAQSPGESRGRWLCWTAGLPIPRTQHEVRDSSGAVRGTCDWWWPDPGVLGEFDGEVKYGRLLKPGQQPGDVVFAEKVREDELRETSGCPMVRLVWRDYDRPKVTAARLAGYLRRAG